MEKTGTQLNLRSRIVAVLLAALMVLGVSFAGANFAAADPTDPATEPAVGITPTGDEYVYNPEDQYICPQGGLFRFSGEGFALNTTIVVQLKSTGALLGSFAIDNDGLIVPAISGEKFAAIIIPEGTVPDSDSLLFSYEDGTELNLAYILEIIVSPTPYTASFEVVRNPNTGERQLHVFNITSGLWAPNTNVFFKIDYRDNPTYGPFATGADGTFDAYINLPNSLINTGPHTFTLLAGEVTVGTDFYPRVSLSRNLTL
jgi:hypothetical protein